jgi:hypothetical protein
MNDLLQAAVNAHGGLERWNQLKTVKASGSDVGTPAYRRRLAGDGKQKAQTNLGSKDNGGAGSSRPLRDAWIVCMNH